MECKSLKTEKAAWYVTLRTCRPSCAAHRWNSTRVCSAGRLGFVRGFAHVYARAAWFCPL